MMMVYHSLTTRRLVHRCKVVVLEIEEVQAVRRRSMTTRRLVVPSCKVVGMEVGRGVGGGGGRAK